MRPIDGVNLRWLVRVRWVAYLGLLLLVSSLQQLARVQFDQSLALIVVGAGLLTNLAASLRRVASRARGVTSWLLFADVGLLTLLLFAMGGPASPLVLGYVLLLVIASAVVPRGVLWRLCGLVLVALLLTALAHAPVSLDHTHGAGEHSHHPEPTIETPSEHLWLHVRELWLATLVLVVLVVYVARWAFDQRESELNGLRAELERNARLAELWTLAASAAHELGTPLSTISVVASELERRAQSSEWGDQVREELSVICEQLERCRAVLGNMTNDARSTGREPSVELSLKQFLSEARDAATAPDRISVQVGADAAGTRANIPRRLLLSVTQSLLDNALDAAPANSRVELRADADETSWSMQITDSGAGLSASDLNRVGEKPFSRKSEGMGVGLFLGRAIVDRLGGTLEISSGDWGTTARLRVPRALSPSSALASLGEAELT